MKNGFFIMLLGTLLSASAWSKSIKTVSFIQEGEISKLIIEVDGEVMADRFHVKDDKQIILDLKDVKADKKVLRGINTSEFDGATVYISGYPKPGAPTDIRFAIQLRDNVRSILDKTGNKIVLNIENRFGVFSSSRLKANGDSVATAADVTDELKADRAQLNTPKSASIEDILQNLTLSGPKRYIGKKISIYVNEISVAEILGMIADSSGFNIIIDNDVMKAPPLTLSLTNIPWDQALDTVMTISKLVAEKNSNILTIKTMDKAQAETEARAKAEDLKMGLEPLVSKIFPISHATLADLQKILAQYLTKRGKISEDVRTNSLIVSDTVNAIEEMKKIIEILDTQTPQILIETKIVESAESNSKRIGLTNGITFGYDPLTPASFATRAPTTDIAVGGGAPAVLEAIPSASFNFSSASLGAGSTALGLTVTTFKRIANLNMSLELLETESKVRIVTAPKVITKNKQPAKITSTETTSYSVTQVTNGAAEVGYEQVNVTTDLTVTPQVTNEGSINLDVTVAKGSFGDRPSAEAPPNLINRQLKTNVLVDNGSTIVLGGLYTTQNSESHSGIPFMKDLPLVGWLFRTPQNPASARNELLIFLTPRIINQEEAGLIDRTNDSSAKL